MNWSAELSLAIQAARAGGAHLAEIMPDRQEILSDAGRDIKLAADRTAEQIILELLQNHASYPILAEESGEHGVPKEGPFWVVDPLDGTLNYSRGLPLCCVSIALLEGETPRVGVVYDFNRNRLYFGVPGERAGVFGSDGAERPLAVSAIRETSRSVLMTGFPTHRDHSAEALMNMCSEIQAFKKVRMLGTAALSLAQVACGCAEAYAEDEIMLWDVAAGLALIKAAGGYLDVRPSGRLKWARHVRAASHHDIWKVAGNRS